MSALRQPKRLDIKDVPVSERVSQMWMNVDDVLRRIPIGRSHFWAMIKNGTFPRPHYKYDKTPLWSQADLRSFIVGAALGKNVFAEDGKTPVTWSAIVALLKREAPCGMTNLQIANLLNANVQDVTLLTRLIAKAGEIMVLRPIRSGSGAPNFYSHSESVK